MSTGSLQSRLAVAGFLLVICAGPFGWRCEGVRDPATIWGLSPSPGGGNIAFTVIGEIDVPSSVWVIDSAGKFVARTSPPATPTSHDMPLGWFPDGQTLLCRRISRGPSGYDADTCRLFLLSADTGDTRPIDFRLCERGGALVIDSTRIICRVRTGEGRSGPGLYLLRRADGKWQPTNLFSDTPRRKLEKCLWAARENSILRLIVRTSERSPAGKVSIALRAMSFGGEQHRSEELIHVFEGSVHRCKATPDGSRVAAVTEESKGKLALSLISTTSTKEGISKVLLPHDVGWPSFSPDGRKVLLWGSGLRYLGPGWAPHVLIVKMERMEVEEIRIPSDIPGLSWAEWLSDEILLLGVLGEGIVRLNILTGEHDYLWRISGTPP